MQVITKLYKYSQAFVTRKEALANTDSTCPLLYAQVTCPKFQYVFLVAMSSGHLMSVLQEQPQSRTFKVIVDE